MSKHSPGPWSEVDRDGFIRSGTKELLRMRSGTAADARLIAAAPELLEALRETAHRLNAMVLVAECPELARAWALVARIEGQ